jgi:hypothetical protein
MQQEAMTGLHRSLLAINHELFCFFHQKQDTEKVNNTPFSGGTQLRFVKGLEIASKRR